MLLRSIPVLSEWGAQSLARGTWQPVLDKGQPCRAQPCCEQAQDLHHLHIAG